MNDSPSPPAPSGNVLSRQTHRALPLALKAYGIFIEDDAGRQYLDASGGAVVVNVGQAREKIARAVYDQIMTCHYAHPTMFSTPPAEALARRLTSHAPPGMDRFYFVTSGTEAVEAAIKLARQIQLDRGHSEKIRLISRWKSYHGLTLGTLSAMSRSAFHEPYMPLLGPSVHIPPPYCLRCSYGLTYPDCRLRCALALDEVIQNIGPRVVSAFLAETVSGGTLAGYPPPAGYWPLIREICDRYEVLLIADEVMCGMGRTGRWYACEHYGVTPDIVTLGKGLSGGVLPLAALGVRSAHTAVLRQPAGFIHGGTFTHHPVTCAAGLAVVEILEDENLVDQAAARGQQLGQLLQARLGDHPHVGHIRGLGMLWGIELVQNRQTLEPWPRQNQVTEKLWNHLFDRGIIVYKSTGLAGIHGDALLIAPPFIITSEQLNTVVEAVGEAVEAVTGL